MKKYTFDLIAPKGFKNKLIVVEAENEKIAKRKLLKELHLINKKLIKVRHWPRVHND